MAGKKGRSGRKTIGLQNQHILFGMDMLEWLKKNFHKLSFDKQCKIATDFGLKGMPTQVNSEINMDLETKVTENQSDAIVEITRKALREGLNSPN